MIYFTSDLHFDHDNIIKYCNRPYKDTTEMNNMLIANWNSIVKPQDTVYILGDIMMSKNAGDVSKYIERLTGHKILIQGNHDYFVKDYKNQRYDFLDDIKSYEEINYNKQRFCLMHYPIMDWNHMYHGSYMLHGHMHNEPIYNYNNKNEGLKRYDVGVDANNYTPVSIEQIINFFK